MPTFYNFRENGLDYSFDDIFVPADWFREGNLYVWGGQFSPVLGNNTTNVASTPVTTFAGGTNWKQVAGGGNQTVAIKTDGTLWTWGSGNQGRLGVNDTSSRITPVTTFAGGSNWKQVSAFNTGTVAIKTDGTLWTWGRGAGGMLGTNDTTQRNTPVTTFAGGTNWKQVAGGTSHIAAIKTDGTLWTWGYGNFGRLGNNDTTDKLTPVTTFAGGTNWKQILLNPNANHTAAIKTDGTLWTWGQNANGQLGINDTTQRSTPVTTFAGGTNWKQVSGGSNHTAAIKTDGTLWSWGNPVGVNVGFRLTPVTTFAGGTNWADTPTSDPEDLYTISAGSSHTSAIKTDGTLWTWGLGSYGRLGTNDTTSRSNPVTTFAGGTNWKQVSSGNTHTAAIKTDGTLWTWGYNNRAQLGTNDTTQRNTPVTTFAGGTNWKQVSCGRDHTTAIKTDGTLWTWGFGNQGRLGTNDTTQRSTPVTTFAGGTNWKQVSAGGFHTTAIKTDGTLWSWGFNTSGQLGTNDITQRNTPVTTFAGGNNWKQVSGGGSQTAAIKTDGTLWSWGVNNNGQLGTNDIITKSTPVTTFAGGTNWKQVSGGSNHTAALSDDGTNKQLYLFGSNVPYQLGIPDTFTIPNQVIGEFTNWRSVHAGGNRTAAIKTDGTLWIWGIGSVLNGTNDLESKPTPVTTFAGGTNWKQVYCFTLGTAAVTYEDPVI